MDVNQTAPPPPLRSAGQGSGHSWETKSGHDVARQNKRSYRTLTPYDKYELGLALIA